MSKFTVICFFIFVANARSARILAVYPTPSISHQIVFRPYTNELVKQGHEVVVLTPDPLYRNKTAPENLKEIDMGILYKVNTEKHVEFKSHLHMERGIITETDDWFTQEVDPFFMHSKVIFQIKEVIDLIEDKYQKFDLIVVESVSYLPLIFCEIFKAPAILFSSLYGMPLNYATVGAVVRHPILYPHPLRNEYKDMNIFQKMRQLYKEWKYYNYDVGHQQNVDEFIKSNFHSFPPVSELKKYVSMLFVNSHPIIDGNRPTPPGVLYLHALQLQPVKELPESLKDFLDNSKRGVIYVSFGTNVHPSWMAPELLKTLTDAFEVLPYDILWKFDGDNLKNLSENIKIQKWFPQRDLLAHPNVKLFITHGGFQSFGEAIDAAVPLVGIPILGDQWFNVDKMQEFGLGIALDSYTFNTDDLVKAVNEVITDTRYKENMLKFRNIVNDQPEKPLDRAVWWTEYVIRHKGSRHLLSKAADISWSEYLMADVLIALAVMLFMVVSIFVSFLYFVLKSINKVATKIKKD